MMNDPIARLRMIGLIEGISFLLLLFVAMPLKYVMNISQGVAVIGMIHGVLFMLYILAVLSVKASQNWSIGRALGAIIAGILPFGPIVLNKRLL
ncbi:integral membrane protein [Aneurinibacillus soli]|uniref:Uncharacterized protein n=1 Tax=Aneurinibacillus soli TaxID=1500254 RepID=A0A0U5BJK9_9BACL|nr:DUF3817 domain-containing protein [Aneurinibacillus soli]PYE61760.1 integral membrane protein [Aneurinibacillus soli]BAU28382.1 hypothetical protein CB4_02556 [Aneurinibacillus soli]